MLNDSEKNPTTLEGNCTKNITRELLHTHFNSKLINWMARQVFIMIFGLLYV